MKRRKSPSNEFKALASRLGYEYAVARFLPGVSLMIIGKSGAASAAKLLEKGPLLKDKKKSVFPKDTQRVFAKLPAKVVTAIEMFLDEGGSVWISERSERVRFGKVQEVGWSDGYYDFLPKGWEVNERKNFIVWSKPGAKSLSYPVKLDRY